MLFLLGVHALLAGLLLAFPGGTIPLFNGMELRLASWESLYTEPEEDYADISELVAAVAATDVLALDPPVADSLETDTLPALPDTVRADASVLKQVLHPIEYPPGPADQLHPFLANLNEAKAGNALVRVAFYGDSQLEGDRITSVVRELMQRQFGGCGVGLLPITDVSGSRLTVVKDHSDNWQKFTVIGSKENRSRHRNYGLMGSHFRFSPELPDTAADRPESYEATVALKPSYLGYKRNRKHERLSVLYGNSFDSCLLELQLNEDTLHAVLPASEGFSMMHWPLPATFQSIGLRFQAVTSPDIYGLSLDCQKGVAVDNISLRGSSAVEFVHLDQNYLLHQLRAFNSQLVVVQCGINVVPSDRESYDFYRDMLKRQLRLLRKVDPEVAVVVIGVSDVAEKEGDRYATRFNVELIRDAQRSAALETGCLFWDLYEAMGGRNSMPSWVFAQPSLAAKDFTHFNARGARIIGHLFHNALIHEYQTYQRTVSN
ncbi:MAG: GDSL-type esterase/lipase family protein [Bacteroidota bacterium]